MRSRSRHLLLGFLLEDQNSRELMARHLGVDVADMVRPAAVHSEPFLSPEVADKLRVAILQSSPPGVSKPAHGDMLVAEPSRTALEAAMKRAGNSTVGTLHLLWGLMTKGGDSVRDLLRSNGGTVQQIEQAIQDRL